MGYSHGQKWTEEKIIDKIKYVMEKVNIKTMPTARVMNEITGNSGLSMAISKRGGTLHYANKLGLELSKCETLYGRKFEELCCENIKNIFGYNCSLMNMGYPYDILCNGIKIDVKVSRLIVQPHGCYYSCNIEKKNPTCDIFVVYCVDENDNILKTYIIPSLITIGKTQISIGQINSKYDYFKDNWDCVEKYNTFFEYIINECPKVLCQK